MSNESKPEKPKSQSVASLLLMNVAGQVLFWSLWVLPFYILFVWFEPDVPETEIEVIEPIYLVPSYLQENEGLPHDGN